MAVSRSSTSSNIIKYVAEIRELHTAILQKNQQFEEAAEKTKLLALQFNTLNPEIVTTALANLIQIKGESDALLAPFGKKMYDYLFHVKGTAHRLALAIYPRSLEARVAFLQRILAASIEEEEKIPKLVDVPEL